MRRFAKKMDVTINLTNGKVFIQKLVHFAFTDCPFWGVEKLRYVSQEQT